MPTPKAGNREDQEELFIYKNKLQTVINKTREKLQALTKIADTIGKTEEEEKKVREELTNYILESGKVHGPLPEKLVTLDDHFKLLAELEQELMDIRK